MSANIFNPRTVMSARLPTAVADRRSAVGRLQDIGHLKRASYEFVRMPFATRSARRAHHQRKRQAMKTHGVSAVMGIQTDGSVTLGCPGRIRGKKHRKSASSMFSKMPFAARSALAGHRQADAPAQTQFRVTEDSANGARVQMCQNEGHRDASQYNISSM